MDEYKYTVGNPVGSNKTELIGLIEGVLVGEPVGVDGR
jgi:hypothetical protein